MNPFVFIREREIDEFAVEIKFTVSLLTAFFGRYDNESPPLIVFFL